MCVCYKALDVTAVVPENVPVGIRVIKLTATDPDEGLGGEIKYEFLDEGEANGKSLLKSLFWPTLSHFVNSIF